MSNSIQGRSTILTASGVYFDLLNPTPEAISIIDIATPLSRICRFGGHTRHFYSVAQHSVMVSHLVSPEHALQALLHDAAEAYVGDVVSPLKALLPEYKLIERRIQAAVFKRYGLPHDLHPSIKEADLVALATEQRDLMNTQQGDEWPILKGIQEFEFELIPNNSALAQMVFLNRFVSLLDPKAEIKEAW